MTDGLRAFLEANVPAVKPGKKSKFALGVGYHNLGGTIQDALSITCVCNDVTAELIRGVRNHLSTFLSALRPGDLERAQLGLAHSYSRSKVRTSARPARAAPAQRARARTAHTAPTQRTAAGRRTGLGASGDVRCVARPPTRLLPARQPRCGPRRRTTTLAA